MVLIFRELLSIRNGKIPSIGKQAMAVKNGEPTKTQITDMPFSA
jgi:hypothetical protein